MSNRCLNLSKFWKLKILYSTFTSLAQFKRFNKLYKKSETLTSNCQFPKLTQVQTTFRFTSFLSVISAKEVKLERQIFNFKNSLNFKSFFQLYYFLLPPTHVCFSLFFFVFRGPNIQQLMRKASFHYTWKDRESRGNSHGRFFPGSQTADVIATSCRRMSTAASR